MIVNEKSWHSKISEFSHRISHHITTKVYSLNVIVTENKQACLQTSCNNLKLYLSRSREVSLQIHDWMRLAYHFNAETTLQAMQWRYATSCHWSHSAIQPHSGSRVMAAVFYNSAGALVIDCMTRGKTNHSCLWIFWIIQHSNVVKEN